MPDNVFGVREVLLTTGVQMRCRPVPPFATAAVRSTLPDPPFPQVTVESAAGGPEKHPALPETPEYKAWVIAKEKHRRELGLALERFTFNYGVVAWRFPAILAPGEPTEEGKDVEGVVTYGEWLTSPPDEWYLDDTLQDYGIKALKGPDRRAQYILYELILNDRDSAAVEEVVIQPDPLGKEEVLAALAPFVSKEMTGLSNTPSPEPEE